MRSFRYEQPCRGLSECACLHLLVQLAKMCGAPMSHYDPVATTDDLGTIGAILFSGGDAKVIWMNGSLRLDVTSSESSWSIEGVAALVDEFL